MNKIIQPCNPIVGVNFGQTATLDLTIGPRYHALRLEFITTAASACKITLADVLTSINVKIGGRVQRSMLASEMDGIYKGYGAAFASKAYNYDGGVIATSSGAIVTPVNAKQHLISVTIFFAEPWRKSYAATEAMAWYTAWQDGTVLKSFQVEIVCPTAGSNVLSGATLACTAYAETDNALGPIDSNKQPVQLITRWERTQVPYSGNGDNPIVNLPKRDVLCQASLFTTASGHYANAVKVKLDNAIIRDVTNVRNFESQIDREWNGATGLDLQRFDVAFDYSDLPTDGLPLNGARDFQIIPNMTAAASAAGTMTIISQVYGKID